MKYNINYILPFFFGATLLTAKAQQADTLTELDQVNVIKSYEPVLIASNKVPFTPDAPKFTKEKPDPQPYVFSDIQGKVPYGKEDIRPIKYAPKKAEKQPFFYLKAGFGNYLTPLVQARITNPDQRKYRAGLSTDFIFSKAKKPKYQQYFDLDTRGFGEYFIKKSASIGGDIRFGMDRYNFYGFPDSLDFGKDTIRNTYNRFGASLVLKNIEDVDYYDYRAEVGFGTVSNSLNQKETEVNVNVNGHYGFKHNYFFGGKLWVNNRHFSNDTTDYNRFSVSAIPFAKVRYKIWQLQGGPNIIITNKKFYLYPHIQNQLQIYKDYLVMYNEWNSQLKINGLDAVSRRNPFVDDAAFYNQVDETRTFAGLRGTFSGFGYDVRFSQLVSHNSLQFNGYTDSLGITRFANNYVHKVFAWNPHIGISYARGTQFGVRFGFDYFRYYKNATVDLAYLPDIKADLGFFYNWNEKLNITLNVIGLGKMNGIDRSLADPVIPVRGLVDVNLSASYFINKHIGFFVDLNNLAFQKYQRYNNYPTYGFHAIGGVKISY